MNEISYTVRRLLGRGMLSLVFGVAATLGVSSAQATLLDGKTVSFTYLFSDISTVYPSSANGNYVVGAGVEIPSGFCCGFEGTLNVSDTNLLADFVSVSTYSPASFNGFRISDVFATIDPFTSVTINALTNMFGFDASRVTFDADNIWVNWQGLSFDSGTFVSLDIGGTTVPEPATLALLGLGLAGLGFSRRKK